MVAPAKDEWLRWGFLERLDWCALDVSKNGPGMPGWMIGFFYVKWLAVQIVFASVVLSFPTEHSLDRDGSLNRDGMWHIYVRYAVYCHMLHGMAIHTGPGSRWTGGAPGLLGVFSFVPYRMTPGAMKTGLFRCLGDRRTAMDVLVNVLFFGLSAAAVLSPEPEPMLVASICACDLWFVLFDYNAYLSSLGGSYFGVLVGACLLPAQGGRAGAQVSFMIVWIGSGLGKRGPWLPDVNAAFLCSSYWLGGQEWLWKLMYKGPSDLRPTRLGRMMSFVAAVVEFGAPALLFFAPVPGLVKLGIALSAAMHGYITFLIPFDLVLWNWFFGLSAVFLFANCGTVGFDYEGWLVAPWPVQLVSLWQVMLMMIGLIFPAQASGLFLAKKGVAHKITDAIPTYGRPAWVAVPEWARNEKWLGSALTIPEMGLYKGIALMYLHKLNLKCLPSLLRQALKEDSISDFHLMYYDSGACSWSPERCEQYVRSLQARANFEEGECICISVSAFPRLGQPLEWKIIDAQAGVRAQGRLNVVMAEEVASLPSACEVVQPSNTLTTSFLGGA